MSELHENPLLRGNAVTLTELNKYVEIISVESDAATDLLIGHIRIDIKDTTALPMINVSLDGKPYIKNFPILGSNITFDWGRRLKLTGKHKKPIVIEIKQTAAGTGDLTATAFVDGLEIPAGKV